MIPNSRFCYLLRSTKMIAAEMEKSTPHCNAPVQTELVEEMLTEALQVGYESAKNGVKTILLNLVGEVIVDIIQ